MLRLEQQWKVSWHIASFTDAESLRTNSHMARLSLFRADYIGEFETSVRRISEGATQNVYEVRQAQLVLNSLNFYLIFSSEKIIYISL